MTTSPRTLGTSDITVSTVGVGCNAFGTRIDADQTRAVVDAAFEHGVTFFDTADSYGTGQSEQLLGAMTELVKEGKVRAIGSSNLQAWQVVDADWTSKTKGLAQFVTAQNEY